MYRTTTIIAALLWLAACSQDLDAQQAVNAVSPLGFPDRPVNCSTAYNREVSPADSEFNEFVNRQAREQVVEPIRMACYLSSTTNLDMHRWSRENDPIAIYALALLMSEPDRSMCDRFDQINGALDRVLSIRTNVNGREIVRVPEALYSKAVLYQSCDRDDWRSILERSPAVGLNYRLMISPYGA
jgi:hypothetical protein